MRTGFKRKFTNDKKVANKKESEKAKRIARWNELYSQDGIPKK